MVVDLEHRQVWWWTWNTDGWTGMVVDLEHRWLDRCGGGPGTQMAGQVWWWTWNTDGWTGMVVDLGHKMAGQVWWWTWNTDGWTGMVVDLGHRWLDRYGGGPGTQMAGQVW
ncbi:hypothetical protein Pcinc_009688 [Petrolisthes cinctipes]|uniref:Uncharacterized protein n=1 Tax=Petrolisthes cinctipes TaxID=88211 RepID=A0AAE1G6T6_PETCI|nr:hypothetical protein Pcinc_009688 [Petrolisthes cinctipes]